MRNALALQGVTKRYGDVVALHPADLTIAAGEFMTFLGPSGSGKTTLLMIIAGFVEPSGGRLLVDGRDITQLPPERRDFGVVFQGYALFPHLSVRNNIAFPLRARGVAASDARRKVDAALELTQLGTYADRKPSELSGGQQQRVALARALVFEPDLLLLDEPLSALDKALRKDLQDELKALHRRVGTTFIYVTHDQEEALAMSDRIAILRHGTIQQTGSPRTLYERPQTAFVASFLGKSNLLEGRIESIGPTLVAVRAGALDLHLAAEVRRGSKVGDLLNLGLRPERVELSSKRPSAAENTWQGKIENITYLGAVAEVALRVTSGESSTLLNAVLPAQTLDQHAIGAPVWASCAADAPVVLRAESETDR